MDRDIPKSEERYQCTAEPPWDPSKGSRAVHDNTEDVGEQQDGYPGGDLQRVRCKNCGKSWTMELPQ